MKIEADYVVVGAGAMGMAFTDTLLEATDATVALVDAHHRPGGHWNDAYPFVRLHQPSAFYGVESAALGRDRIDAVGWNQGLFELASGAEVCAYFDQIMQGRFLPSGRVQYFPMCTYDADTGVATSTPSGETFEVEAGRARVDATYMNVKVPSVCAPLYEVAPEVRLTPPNGLPRASRPESGYVIVGAGKTAIDACLWLLANRVDPESITWIVPRDSWLLDRAKIQPGPAFKLAEQFEIIAGSDSMANMFEALEAGGHLLRLDPDITPTMYRCATVTQAELEQLRRVRHVVRMGRVVAIGASEVSLEQGKLACDTHTLFVDCTADGLEKRPGVPIFRDALLTLQAVRPCQQVFSAALIARVEGLAISRDEQNALCEVAPHPDSDSDFLYSTRDTIRSVLRWAQSPELLEWLAESRLNAGRGAPPPSTEAALGALAKVEAMIAEHEASGSVAR